MKPWIIIVCLCLFHALALAGSPIEPGQPFPGISLPAPGDSHQRDYLGLPRGRTEFMLHEVTADTIIVQVFSMYCPHCQRMAPAVNELYHIMKAAEEAGTSMKLIGIAGGNSVLETSIFRDKYDVPFPLFPDEDARLSASLGVVRTPHFFVLAGTGKTLTVVLSHVGGFDDPHRFLDEALRAAENRHKAALSHFSLGGDGGGMISLFLGRSVSLRTAG